MATTITEPAAAELTVDERVRNGVAFLDEHVPGWREKVDPAALDQESVCRCVLGQLFGTWGKGVLHLLALSAVYPVNAKALGFDRDLGESFSYADLTAAWKRELSR